MDGMSNVWFAYFDKHLLTHAADMSTCLAGVQTATRR